MKSESRPQIFAIASTCSAALLLLTIGGCETSRQLLNRDQPTRIVSVDEFVHNRGDVAAGEHQAVAEDPEGASEADGQGSDGARDVPLRAMSDDLVASAAGSGAESSTEDGSRVADDRADRVRGPARRGPIVVESLIGQINGRPLFASEFFGPIDDQLAALADRLPREELVPQARQIILDRLAAVVRSELFLAEAESALSAEEHQGLFALLRGFEEQTVSRYGGGDRAEAQRRLLEEQQLDLEEYRDLEKNKALIKRLIGQEVRPRVSVSWRDVQREYERMYDEFNPPGKATLSQIALSKESQAELIEETEQRLQAGEPFAEVAESLGLEDGGRWREFETGAGGLADIALTDAIKKHVVDLEVGETTPPIEIGSRVYWIHLTEIDQPEGRSIYHPQVQRAIFDSLFRQRFATEEDRYMRSLLEEGIYDELNAMADRLIAIALTRYAP